MRVLAALRAASLRSRGERRRAASFAWRASASVEAARRGIFLSARSAARERVGEVRFARIFGMRGIQRLRGAGSSATVRRVKGYDPRMTFGPEEAARYDEGHVRGDEETAAEFLAALARGGRALELAIGTGRIALPLAARGVAVEGVDFSEAMVARLRAKPGGEQIPVTIGDFSEAPARGPFRLVYVVFNTLFNLLTQEAQVRCFENAAARLEPGGAFVVEAFVPAWLHRLEDAQYVAAEAVDVARVVLDVGRHDPVAQTLDESHVVLSAQGTRVTPIVCRYAWPAELDLMARIAGLRLRERWGGWSREPFTADSRNCVSVWEKAAQAS